jgi:AraC-like DNA-binding protein
MTIAAQPVKELHGKSGATHAALYAPHPSLASCVRAYLSRSTNETATLTPDERCNYFPPTPTCMVVWVIRGHDSRIPEDVLERHHETKPMPVLFSGPHKSPSFSENLGPVHFFTMLIYPDALRAMTGLAIEQHLGQYSSFWTLFDEQWQSMARAVFFAENDVKRVCLIEEYLLPRWAEAKSDVSAQRREDDPSPSNGWQVKDRVARFGTWSRGVALSAAQHEKNISERQIDRRIKSRTGQNLRQLLVLSRMELALIEVNKATHPSNLSWPRLAFDSGFSDQAHMCREFRRHLGMGPGEMMRSLNEESAWVLRIWA